MPLDRHLLDGYPELLREQEQLDVEDPRREVLIWENLLCGGAREELEPALGIADVPDPNDAQDGVEAIHEEIADEGALRREK